jgi:hypothetical protein
MSLHPVESGKEVRSERPGRGEFIAARRNPRFVLADSGKPIDPDQRPNEIKNNRYAGNGAGPLRISGLRRLEHPDIVAVSRPVRPHRSHKGVRMPSPSSKGPIGVADAACPRSLCLDRRVWGVRLILQSVFDIGPSLTGWWMKAGYALLTAIA